MQPYPAYKDSGFDWLKEVPKHWDPTSIRAITKVKTERNKPDLPLLSVYRDYGVIYKDSRDDNHNRAGMDLSNYKVVSPNDLVINKMKTWQGSLGVSQFEGIVSPAYIVCNLDNRINGRYLNYLLRCRYYVHAYNRISYGVRVDQWDMHYQDFKQLPVFLPSPGEQDAIVSFLDEQTAVIDKFIANKRRLIELLGEQKQVVVNTAVTQGLDPTAPRKPSGIDWLGDIPAHWEEKRAKYFFHEIDERSETGEEELLSVSHITGVTPRSEKNITMFKAKSYKGYKTCQPDDLVINIMWAWMGAMGVSQHHGIVSSAYGVYRQRKSNTYFSPYLDHLVRVNQYIAEYTCRSTGIRSSRLRMYTDDFFDMPIIRPPYDEQVAIAKYIDDRTDEIDAAIKHTQREIELIEEFRTTLIAHAVTGKINVRFQQEGV